jgi:hypothetical protein
MHKLFCVSDCLRVSPTEFGRLCSFVVEKKGRHEKLKSKKLKRSIKLDEKKILNSVRIQLSDVMYLTLYYNMYYNMVKCRFFGTLQQDCARKYFYFTLETLIHVLTDKNLIYL